MPNIAGSSEFLELDACRPRQNPKYLKAIQYDIVCNGVELSSGAIRNHRPDVMKQAFAIAGYDESVLQRRFGGMLHARCRSARRRTAALRPASTALSCCCVARRTCARWCCSR